MAWSQEAVSDWGDLSYLLLEQYDRSLLNDVEKAELWEGQVTAHGLAAASQNKV